MLFKLVTETEVQQIVNACNRVRDKFLVCLLYETGLRLGEALGLRHEDIRSEGENLIHVVFRDDNFNGARAKTRERAIHVQKELMQLYSEYLIDEYPLEKATDYVFVNCWDGKIGEPTKLGTAKKLFQRLQKKTGIKVHAHLLRHTHYLIQEINNKQQQQRSIFFTQYNYNLLHKFIYIA